MPKILAVKPYAQSPDLCGPSCLKMVLAFFGVDVSEDELAVAAKSRFGVGTGPRSLCRAAKRYGFRAHYRTGATLANLRRYVAKDMPVIVAWFAHDDKHYSVVVGIDEEYVYLQDPEIGKTRRLPHEVFLRVWFDFPGDHIRSRLLMRLRSIIVVKPKR